MSQSPPAPPQGRPYGRRGQGERNVDPRSPQFSRRYRGESYYGRPSLKASHWGWLIAGYYFIGGLAGGAQVLATIADLTDRQGNRSLVRAGRYLALFGVLASPPLLIADLHTPNRFYNMLRIVRPTSPMSLGSWVLMAFSLWSGLTAAAQGAADLTKMPGFTRLARWCGIPAAISGTMMATYTGALTTATSVPLWSTIPRQLPALFGLASSASALAALGLVAEVTPTDDETKAEVARLTLLVGLAELVLHSGIIATWQRHKVMGALNENRWGAVHKVGMVGLGALLPTALHLAQGVRGRHSRATTIAAAVATLIGIFCERAVIVFGGNQSARRPVDYLRLTQPRTKE